MQVTTSTLSNNSVNLCSLSDDHDDDDGGGDGGSDILGHCVGRNRTVSEVSDGHLDTGDEDVYHDYQTFPPYPDFTQLNSVRLTFIVIYSIVIVLSIVGNALVCITVYRNKKMHTAVNYYIVNLALCDLLVGAFVMPMKLLELTAPADWNMLNDASCTLMMYIQTVFVFSSVLTLVATCVER